MRKIRCKQKLTLEAILAIVALLALGIVYFVDSHEIAKIKAELADLERLEQMAINTAVLVIRDEKAKKEKTVSIPVVE